LLDDKELIVDKVVLINKDPYIKEKIWMFSTVIFSFPNHSSYWYNVD